MNTTHPLRSTNLFYVFFTRKESVFYKRRTRFYAQRTRFLQAKNAFYTRKERVLGDEF
jgi:hypothetical protein